MNFIDVIVLVVIGLSALIAFSNGFVNVVLWILSWVGAVVATVYFFPVAKPIAAPTPASTMPSGDVMARATRGVKNRSRNERAISHGRLGAPLGPTAARLAEIRCGSRNQAPRDGCKEVRGPGPPCPSPLRSSRRRR